MRKIFILQLDGKQGRRVGGQIGPLFFRVNEVGGQMRVVDVKVPRLGLMQALKYQAGRTGLRRQGVPEMRIDPVAGFARQTGDRIDEPAAPEPKKTA